MIRTRRSLLALAGAGAAGAAIAPLASGQIVYPGFPYFVSTGGNDAADGRSWETSFRTITRAMELARVGSNVFVGPGVFVETVNLARCNLIGYGPNNGSGGTTIKAPSTTADCIVIRNKVEANIYAIQTQGSGLGWAGRGISFNQGGYLTIERWRHGNQDLIPTNEGAGTGLFLAGNAEHITLRRCAISNAGRAIHGYSCSMVVFDGVTLTTSWKDLHLEFQAGGLTFRAVKATASAPRPNAEDCVWIGTGLNVFDDCDFSETFTLNTVRVANGDQGNVFLAYTSSPGTQTIVEGNRNRFIGSRFSKALRVSGRHNHFDGCYDNAPNLPVVSGDFNSFDDWYSAPKLAAVTGSRNVWRRPYAKYYGVVKIDGTYNLIDEPDFPKPTTYQLAPTNEVRKMGA